MRRLLAPRKRATFRVAVLLLAGAIVNVAVAWVSASTIVFLTMLPVTYTRQTTAGEWTIEILRRPTAFRMVWKRDWWDPPFPHAGLFPPGESLLPDDNELYHPENVVPDWFEYSPSLDST